MTNPPARPLPRLQQARRPRYPARNRFRRHYADETLHDNRMARCVSMDTMLTDVNTEDEFTPSGFLCDTPRRHSRKYRSICN
jgi:hypothetical protein